MSLLNAKNANATVAADTPAFEAEESMVAGTTGAGTGTTTVSVRNTGAVAISAPPAMIDIIATLRGVLPVEYNTLAQVKCTNGNFVEREGNLNLGDTIVFELLSWQDSYTVTTNEDKAPIETLKFSDDGITCKDGTPVADHVAALKEQGYIKAGVKHRLVVVGAVHSAAKSDKYNGNLVQFDLSPESRVLFQRYQATTAWGVKAGKLLPEQVVQVKGATRLVTKGSNTYTVVDFTTA